MTPNPTLPESCGVAFKEWAGVCDALARGRQALILRKGGIDEGPGGFAPRHPAFWLYPTQVHQAGQGLRELPDGPALEAPPRGVVEIRAFALVESVDWVESLDVLAALEPWHVLTRETVESRFRYRGPGLWAIGVRVYRRAEPWSLVETPEHAGCKTWVEFDPPRGTAGLVPALDDAEHDRRRALLRAALATPGGVSRGAGAGRGRE